jgi:hypothetical protein
VTEKRDLVTQAVAEEGIKAKHPKYCKFRLAEIEPAINHSISL